MARLAGSVGRRTDIGFPEVVTEVAADVGLDSDAVETALFESTWEDNYRDSIDNSQCNGISRVPTVVYGGRTARGAMPPEQLSRLVDGMDA
jgi:Predicted dithiol-disulfide isomerase involved in polyketide biosynthesis